jgi:hypothetical protein
MYIWYLQMDLLVIFVKITHMTFLRPDGHLGGKVNGTDPERIFQTELISSFFKFTNLLLL